MSGQITRSPTQSPNRRAPQHAAQQLVDGVARVLTKPRFRGWIHVYSP